MEFIGGLKEHGFGGGVGKNPMNRVHSRENETVRNETE